MIKHMTQPTNNSCVATCLAMLLDLDIDTVLDEFHDEYIHDKINTSEYLKKKGLKHKVRKTIERQLFYETIYLASVPSLNVSSLMHQIIVYCGVDREIKVFDPAKGMEDKFYYVWSAEQEDESEFACSLNGFCIDVSIDEKDFKEWRRK